MADRRFVRQWVAIVVAIGPVACRDALEPWTPTPVPADSSAAIQLTFGTGSELYPVWSPDGSEVIYVSEAFPGSPPGRGLLFALPRLGGPARLVLPELQGPAAGGPRFLAAAAPSPDGAAVAYFDLVSVAQPGVPVVSTMPCLIPEPVLDSAVLRVRTIGSAASILDDPFVAVPFAGPDPGQKAGSPGPYTTRAYPFQARFSDSGVLSVRASWAPDGSRIAYGDGLRLWTWTADRSPPVPIPGTEDGGGPAWSPDGQWIVFTRVERGDSTTQVCDVIVGGMVVRQLRLGYAIARRVLVRVRPDGSGATELGPGDDPAWSPDGEWIYFRQESRIYRVRADGGGREEIPETQFAQWPAVSPDGRRLAFARWQVSDSTFDLWTVPISR